MGRTDWGMVILGGGALVGIAYVFFNWKTLCHNFGEGACNLFSGSSPGLFGGTITGSGIAQGYGQILTKYDAQGKPASTQVINPSNPLAGASKGVSAGATLRAPKTTKSTRTPPKRSIASAANRGSTAASRAARYTDVNSFATVTLNRLSVR